VGLSEYSFCAHELNFTEKFLPIPLLNDTLVESDLQQMAVLSGAGFAISFVAVLFF
jgi:hypothetical protein